MHAFFLSQRSRFIANANPTSMQQLHFVVLSSKKKQVNAHSWLQCEVRWKNFLLLRQWQHEHLQDFCEWDQKKHDDETRLLA